MIKKIACATLALTLFGSTAAEAHGWGHDGWGHGDGWAALGIGLGILTLGAVAADHDRYYRERDAYERGRYDQQRDDYYRGREYPDRDENRGPPPDDRDYDDDRGGDN
ncbi:MAG: hypothetical protein ISS15_06615 [Alphaproteobacteria bacterium]|nr:hypothetical protein [Alphaproteobacteria bacterium]MBL6938255.1 hypothetical protein [Alphaproteobacteria bacterium]MBL7097311.1 hypothetical protein [Alphaproteobacteria bacterium]